MHLALQILLLVHLIGFAALLGGALVQLRDPEPEISTAMLHGSWSSLVTGVALWVLSTTPEGGLGLAVVVVKLVLTLVVTLLVVVNRRFLSVPPGLLRLITLLVLATTVVSVVRP